MLLLSANDLTKHYGDNLIFENINLSVNLGDKIGFIGSNGVGKTTLFKVLLNQEPYDFGSIFINKECKIGYLKQNVFEGSGKTLYEEVLNVFSYLMKLEDEIHKLNIEISQNPKENLIMRYARLNEEYERLGGLTYKARTRSMLLGLGFSEEELDRPINTLSGGQKTRAALARLLLGDYNLLLLDEPTNHLDIDSVRYLENFLKSYNGSFIVISHDRFFLDEVCNRVINLLDKKIIQFDGNYSSFVKKKEEYLKALTKNYEEAQKEIKRIEGIIEQQRQFNRERNIRMAESKQKEIERIRENLAPPPQKEDEIKFSFYSRKRGANEVLTIKDLSKSYQRPVFNSLNLLVKRGEKVFIVGPNGCGKSTFIKTVAGKISRDSGTIKVGNDVEIGYYDQEFENLNDEKTPFDMVSDTFPNLTNTEIRNALAMFLFTGDDVFKKIKNLSGGEKARLSLLLVMMKKPNFLILDEPTNHLDIPSREVLEEAFSTYDGTLLCVSHDRYFINKLKTKVLYLKPDGFIEYAGGFSSFSDFEKNEKVKKESPKNDYKAKKELESNKRKLNTKISKLMETIDDVEKEIERLTNELTEHGQDYEKVCELSLQIENLKAQLNQYILEWERASEELERLNSIKI